MRASHVAALRRVLLEWLDSADARAYYELMADDPGTWNQVGQRAALADATLFFVSDEMTAVAQHASRSMPDQVPLREEFPAESGFAFWDGSLVAADVVDELVNEHPVAAALSSCHVLSWKLTRLHAYPSTDAYDDTAQEHGSDYNEDEDAGHREDTVVDVPMLTFWIKPEGRTHPPLIPYHSAVLDLTLPIRGSARGTTPEGTRRQVRGSNTSIWRSTRPWC